MSALRSTLSPSVVIVVALAAAACGPRYLIVPDRLTSAKKVAVVQYIVDGPTDYVIGKKTTPSQAVPIRHSLSVANTALEIVEITNKTLTDDGRIEVIPTPTVLAAAGYQLLRDTPPVRSAPGYTGSIPVVSATGFKGTGDDLPVEMSKAIIESGADLGVVIRHNITWINGLANIGGTLRSTVSASIITADGALVYQEKFTEESKVTVNSLMGIADERTLKEAIVDIGTRTGNRLRSVIRTGVPVDP